jgi:hypothetical protein
MATLVICGAVASRERERGSWSGGRAETGSRFPFKETRGAGEMLPRWSVGAGGGCARVRAKQEGWRLGATALTRGTNGSAAGGKGRDSSCPTAELGRPKRKERREGRGRRAGRWEEMDQQAEMEGREE